jgi:acylphosphatase
MENQINKTKRLHAVIKGRVQGVGFRFFVEQNAGTLNLTGWVRNRWNRTVEVMVEGKQENLEKLLAALHNGPTSANVSEVQSDWRPATGEFLSFTIRRTID